MSSEKEHYDPHTPPKIPSRPEAMGTPPREGRPKIQVVQEQVDNTKGEIQKTLHDLANRGKKLEELEEQTAMLSDSATVFKTSSSKVRKTMWWKNAKMTVIITITVILILAAIIIPIVLKFQGKI